ncbi:hypothetical protein [Shewanella aestuarii]|uniref:Uncharacterized protein n=1 Tax=Shewanella aestuarii TaxID=1028752 RepID=A0A6G9QPQ2_9GAMM|nr:hypothetical protein [Shewanella aestuarii]QIR16570.1 hypothetical protein HBH39_19030 [Shewanella aestuarii]
MLIDNDIAIMYQFESSNSLEDVFEANGRLERIFDLRHYQFRKHILMQILEQKRKSLDLKYGHYLLKHHYIKLFDIDSQRSKFGLQMIHRAMESMHAEQGMTFCDTEITTLPNGKKARKGMSEKEKNATCHCKTCLDTWLLLHNINSKSSIELKEINNLKQNVINLRFSINCKDNLTIKGAIDYHSDTASFSVDSLNLRYDLYKRSTVFFKKMNRDLDAPHDTLCSEKNELFYYPDFDLFKVIQGELPFNAHRYHQTVIKEIIAQYEIHACLRMLILNPFHPDTARITDYINNIKIGTTYIQKTNPFALHFFDDKQMHALSNQEFVGNVMHIFKENFKIISCYEGPPRWLALMLSIALRIRAYYQQTHNAIATTKYSNIDYYAQVQIFRNHLKSNGIEETQFVGELTDFIQLNEDSINDYLQLLSEYDPFIPNQPDPYGQYTNEEIHQLFGQYD